MPPKKSVICSQCRKTRYVKPPVPAKYVCRRCRAGTAESRPAVPAPKRTLDPFLNDLPRREAINRQAKPAWIDSRPGWL